MFEIFGNYNEGDLLLLGDWGVLAVVFLVLLGIAVVGVSWYDLRDMRPSRRWTLVGLRIVVYLIAVIMLLEPALELKNVSKVRNHVAVLVDTSRSQTLRLSEDETTRFDRARQYLESDSVKALLTEENEDHIFAVYTFGDELRPASYAEVTNPDLSPRADTTQTLEAIEEVTRQVGRRDLGGFVVISDGIDSGLLGGRVRRGETLDAETEAFLERLDVPVHTVATASSDGLKDLSIEHVYYDDFAFVRNKISVDVVLRVVGFDPERIPVTLKREGQLLQTQQVEVGPDATEYRISFEFVPQQIGKEIYTISTPSYTGEALLENNRKDIVLKVIRDKIRALQVVGRPSWDERFLRQLLKKNPNVDLISFFILRTAENVQAVPTDELSLIPFPTRELFEQELGSFDIVIFQNFNYRPYNMSQYLGRIAEYVRSGGGFVMVGGELSFGSGGYSGTPIGQVLPVILPPPGGGRGLLDETEFVMELTAAGERHPITQLAFDPVANRELWSKLPPLEGINIVLGKRDDATVLAVHPTLKNLGQPIPVVTVAEVEKGRVMTVGSDSTWRWGFQNVGRGGTSRPYQVFWNSAIRWLIKDPELKLLQVEVGETVVTPGDSAPIQVRLVEPDYSPAVGVSGRLEVYHRPLSALDGGEAVAARLASTVEFTTDGRGRANLEVPVDETGAFKVKAIATTGSGTLTDEDIFLATLDSQELRSIQPRENLLELLATSTSGSFQLLPDDDADFTFREPRIVQVNSRRVIEVWDTILVLLVICGLLGAEWLLRRRWGRL